MNWDEYFISLLAPISQKSKDRSTKVGAIAVGSNREIKSTGFNGFVRGINDDKPERHERPLKYKWTEHAERNLIYNAARNGISLDGCTIFIDWFPCTDCARAIIQSGFKAIIIDGRNFSEKEKYWNERWKEDMDISKEMLEEAKIGISIIR